MTRIVVACRTQAYRHLVRHRRFDEQPGAAGGWQTRTLQPLADEQVRMIIRRRLNLASDSSPEQASPQHEGGKVGALVARIADDQTLTNLYASPLSLSLLLTLLDDEAADDPPHDRTHLYDRFVTLTLRAARGAAYHGGLLNATCLANDECSCDMVRRAELQATAFASLPSFNIHETAYTCAAALRDLRQIFPQAAIQEFLAACYLAGLPDAGHQAMALWQGAEGARWRDVLLLPAGRLHQLGLIEEVLLPWLSQLAAGQLAKGTPKSSLQRQRDALLAADSYAELGRRNGFECQRPGVLDQLEAEIAEGLVLVLAQQPLATLDERLSAGAHLAAIGDPRPGVATLEPEWCKVETGPSSASTEENDTTPPDQMLFLPEFQIGRFPVTNAQWRYFMDNDGYMNQVWWVDGYIDLHALQPRFWGMPGFDAANQPVVGISWFEATAFCHWLTARGHADGWLCDDEQVRLPTAIEWEKAARGVSARTYPWGDCWDIDCANTQESNIDAPTPVGCYPQCASPYGVSDMAGNVAEWCFVEAEQPRSVRRGGSWAENHLEARCAAYREIEPETRGNLLGLRVVRARKTID